MTTMATTMATTAAAVAVAAELGTMGRALGGLRHVQGPGGNVSVKVDGTLWVKASGTRLVDVASEAGHAQVSLELARAALAGDEAAGKALFATKPRPSLETYFHALPGRVVAHTHPVGAHLYACSTATEAPAMDVPVREIPYVRPGIGVAHAIATVLEPEAPAQIVVLRSHGIVVFARTVEEAVDLTVRFDEKVRAGFPGLTSFEDQAKAYLTFAPIEAFAGAAPGVFQEVPGRRGNGVDGGPSRYLFPDAAVCASTVEVALLGDRVGLAPFAHAALAAVGRAGVIVDAAGRRVAFARTTEQLAQTLEVLAAHDWVEDTLGRSGTARYLPDDEPAKIVGMPSEQYRIHLAATA